MNHNNFDYTKNSLLEIEKKLSTYPNKVILTGKELSIEEINSNLPNNYLIANVDVGRVDITGQRVGHAIRA